MCETTKSNYERKIKKSLKWFLGLCKTTPDTMLFSLVNVNVRDRGNFEENRARSKWCKRMQVENIIEPIEYSIQCNVRLLPKEVAQFINLQCSLCERCNTIFDTVHFREHGVWVPDVKELLEELNEKISEEKGPFEEEGFRNAILKKLSLCVSKHVDRMIGFKKQLSSEKVS